MHKMYSTNLHWSALQERKFHNPHHHWRIYNGHESSSSFAFTFVATNTNIIIIVAKYETDMSLLDPLLLLLLKINSSFINHWRMLRWTWIFLVLCFHVFIITTMTRYRDRRSFFIRLENLWALYPQTEVSEVNYNPILRLMILDSIYLVMDLW